jgi:hypothetical protein
MILLGGNYQIVKERFSDSYMFTGHRVMYEILRTRRFGYEYDPGVYVYYNLDISRFQIEAIKSKILLDYPFLNSCFIEDDGIGVNVISREYENLFESIMDHSVYPQKVRVSSLSEIDTTISSELRSDSIPLGNSFVSSDGSGFYYLFNSLQNVTDKSISLPRACFVTCIDSTTSSKYYYIPYNRKSIFSKHDASSVTGIDIRYEPDIPYNKELVKQPNYTFGGEDPGPDQNEQVQGVMGDIPIPESDKISDILSENSEINLYDSRNKEETQVDFNPTLELFNRIGLKVEGALSPNINVLPFDLSSDVDILKKISPVTLIQLMNVILKEGARFYMDNYKFNTNSIGTIDNKVSIHFHDSMNGALIPIKDVFDILTVAWFSKNSGRLFNLDDLKNWLSTKIETNIRYEINKKYVITVYGDLHLSGVNRVPPNTIDKGKF